MGYWWRLSRLLFLVNGSGCGVTVSSQGREMTYKLRPTSSDFSSPDQLELQIVKTVAFPLNNLQVLDLSGAIGYDLRNRGY